MKIWRGRPSGHSNYYAIVGVFETNSEAERARNALNKALQNTDRWKDADWEPDDASLDAEGNSVKFSVYTAGYHLDDIEAILNAHKPKETRTYEDPQELEVAFEFDSRDAELEEIKILLLLKHPNLKALIEDSKARVERTEEGKTQCTFEYYGDWIYDSSEGKLLGHPEEELGCTVSVMSE
jgi:hypothetical protein